MIKVRVRLYASLNKYSLNENNFFDVELEEGSSVEGLLKKLGIPPKYATLVIVNGNQQKKTAILQDGDEVRLFPPVAGG